MRIDTSSTGSLEYSTSTSLGLIHHPATVAWYPARHNTRTWYPIHTGGPHTLRAQMGCFRTHIAVLEVLRIGYSEYSLCVLSVPTCGVDCLAIAYVRSGFAGHTGYSEYAH
jgi:hypothetical protein